MKQTKNILKGWDATDQGHTPQDKTYLDDDIAVIVKQLSYVELPPIFVILAKIPSPAHFIVRILSLIPRILSLNT